MAKQNTQAQIRALVDSFVSDLSDLIQKTAYESAMEALSGAMGASRKRGPGRPRKTAAAGQSAAAPKPAPKSRRKRGRRSSKAVSRLTESALQFITANPNSSVADIGSALRASTKELRLPLMKLLSDGLIHTVGQKRGTRYHPGGGGGTRSRKAAPRKKAAKKATRRRKKK